MARGRRCFVLILWTCLLMSLTAAAADDWLPVTPQELAMKESPLSPGAHAVLLYREVETDDVNSVETHYYRIKILTETGKKYADIEIPYIKGLTRVGDIKARIVRPDGSELKFDGEVFDKVLVKARGFKMQVKTFTCRKSKWGPSWITGTRFAGRRINSIARPGWCSMTCRRTA